MSDGSAAFVDGVLGKFSWDRQLDGALDVLSGKNLVLASLVPHQLACVVGQLLVDLETQIVQRIHRRLADSDFGVDLLENGIDLSLEPVFRSSDLLDVPDHLPSLGVDLLLFGWSDFLGGVACGSSSSFSCHESL